MIREDTKGNKDEVVSKIFVTFGDGDFRYRRSAIRLAAQMSRFEIYDLTLALNKKWLKHYYPAIYRLILKVF